MDVFFSGYRVTSSKGCATAEIMAHQASERPDTRPHKLIDIIRQKMEKKERFFSLEFFPPKTFNGATNLMAIIGRLNEHCTPLFCDITWKPSQDPMSDTCQPEPSTLLVSAAAIDLYGQNIMIHIPSGSTTRSQVMAHLIRAQTLGIGSVLAIRGGIIIGMLLFSFFLLCIVFVFILINK